MGASPAERIVPLWNETARGYKMDSRGRKIEGSDFGGERVPITVAQAWKQVYDEDGYESGHSYSGGFGSKDGYTLVASAKVDKELLIAAGDLVSELNFQGEGGDDPLVLETMTYCNGDTTKRRYCSNGKYQSREIATLADGSQQEVVVQRTCEVCNGTGRRPKTDEELAAGQKKLQSYGRAIAAFGLANLKRAASIYDDKWGPAAALEGSDHVWFGGYCSS